MKLINMNIYVIQNVKRNSYFKYPFIFREDESSSEICNSEDFINGIEINNEKIIILWMYFWRDFTYYYYLLSYQI